MRISALSFSCLLATVFFVPQQAQAESFTPVPAAPSTASGLHHVRGVSADGRILIGNTNSATHVIGFRWENAAITEFLDPGRSTIPYAINADGTVIVGSSDQPGVEMRAFSLQGGIYTYLPHLGGSLSSVARAVSTDGSVVVGQSNNQAVRWINAGAANPLGFLAGGGNSIAYGVSGDGSIIVGESTSMLGLQAFRWESGTMTPLGFLPGGGGFSQAHAISADGNVIVGNSSATSGVEAFRWEGGTMTGLGQMAGGTLSQALAVNADGSVIVGIARDAANDGHAAIWRQGDPLRLLSDVLTGAGVDLLGWTLTGAHGVSADGNIVVGRGDNGGNLEAFIADLSTGGLTTPADLVEGVLTASQTAQQTQATMTSGLGQSLFATTMALSSFRPEYVVSANPADIAPASGFERRWSAYAVGSFGIGHNNDRDNSELNGTTGVIAQVSDTLALGIGIIGGTSQQDLQMGGESNLKTAGGSMIAAYEGDAGLRLYGTAFAADLNVEIDRNYVNGAGIDTSHGETDGFGYGAAVRAGWEMPVASSLSVMPYGEIQATKVSLDGYTETDGAFPAVFGSQDSTRVSSRLGLQVNYDVTPTLSFGTRAAWAHSLKDDASSLSVSTTGFTGSLTGEQGDKNWAEGAVSTSWQVTPGTSLQGELSGRTHKTQDPAAALTLGLRVSF